MILVKVDWPGELPEKWKNYLQIALQTWCNTEGFKDCSVNVVQLLGDGHTAEVEITPSAGETLIYFLLQFRKLEKMYFCYKKMNNTSRFVFNFMLKMYFPHISIS